MLVSGNLPGAVKPQNSLNRIQGIADILRRQLGISANVEVRILSANRFGFSTEPVDDSRENFLISVDSAFLSQLDQDDLTAALAHELGHVWIFTHHPYLQTEALANQIAMKAVPRDSLKKLYLKLWTFEGTTGEIDELLGPESNKD